MAYSAELEKRIDEATGSWDVPLTKRKMFSGLAYFVYGNMCFAIRGDELLLRLGNVEAAKVIKLPGVHVAVMGARVMKDWLQAGGEAIQDSATLLELLELGREYALKLPPKR